jgi:hypothetical protein
MNRCLDKLEHLNQVKLQGIGWIPAVLAEDLVVGDEVMWNYGRTSTILVIKEVSRCFIEIGVRSNYDGKLYQRRLKKDRLVGIKLEVE